MAPDDTERNTYMFDPTSPTELARLINQDQMTTRAMGGPFAGLAPRVVEALYQILDLACGPGGWVLDAAFALPEAEVAGVDISRPMINYARARAQSQGLHNASFEVMDITKPLDFADATFDLVNARLLVGVLKQEAWTSFLAECLRLLRPGGVLRLTEPITAAVTTSAAGETMAQYFYQALYQAGYGFSPNGTSYGVTFILPRLLRQHGFQSIQTTSYTLEISEDTEAWAEFYRDIEVGYLQAKPFLVKTGRLTSNDFDRLYQQMITEWNSPGFTGLWHFMTTWGYKPAGSNE